MKQNLSSGLYILLLLLLGLIMALTLTSCGEHPDTAIFKIHKIKVIESSTTSFIRVPTALETVYQVNDTVWVNMILHTIDDTDTNTMKCVIMPSSKYDYHFNLSGGIGDINEYTIYNDNDGKIGRVMASQIDSLINADNK